MIGIKKKLLVALMCGSKWLCFIISLLCVICISSFFIQAGEGVQLPTFFGWGQARVLSGSMEPEIPVNALILIHRQDNYEVGDIVTYNSNFSKSVTHRIVQKSSGLVVTKGDANNAPDEPISETQIIGKVVFIIPGAGAAFAWVQQNILYIVAALIGITAIVETIRSFRKKQPALENNSPATTTLQERG